MPILKKLKKLFGGKSEEVSRFISVVLLWSQSPQLSQKDLEHAVSSALGRPLDPNSNDLAMLLPNPGTSTIGFIRIDRAVINVISSDKSYFEAERIPDLLKRTKEKRIQKVIQDTCAWISFDLLTQNPSPTNIAGFYRHACRVAAALLNDHFLGVLITDKNKIFPYEEGLATKLVSDDPVTALEHWNPVPLVDDSDEEVNAAMATARAKWPEFEQAFHARKFDQQFMVKALFRDASSIDGEWMWVEVDSVTPAAAQGVLVNEPVNVHNVKTGDSVTVPIAEVGDWAFNKGNQMFGGFVDAVLRKRM